MMTTPTVIWRWLWSPRMRCLWTTMGPVDHNNFLLAVLWLTRSVRAEWGVKWGGGLWRLGTRPWPGVNTLGAHTCEAALGAPALPAYGHQLRDLFYLDPCRNHLGSFQSQLVAVRNLFRRFRPLPGPIHLRSQLPHGALKGFQMSSMLAPAGACFPGLDIGKQAPTGPQSARNINCCQKWYLATLQLTATGATQLGMTHNVLTDRLRP